jgi:hypothetical protein
MTVVGSQMQTVDCAAQAVESHFGFYLIELANDTPDLPREKFQYIGNSFIHDYGIKLGSG